MNELKAHDESIDPKQQLTHPDFWERPSDELLELVDLAQCTLQRLGHEVPLSVTEGWGLEHGVLVDERVDPEVTVDDGLVGLSQQLPLVHPQGRDDLRRLERLELGQVDVRLRLLIVQQVWWYLILQRMVIFWLWCALCGWV